MMASVLISLELREMIDGECGLLSWRSHLNNILYKAERLSDRPGSWHTVFRFRKPRREPWPFSRRLVIHSRGWEDDRCPFAQHTAS